MHPSLLAAALATALAATPAAHPTPGSATPLPGPGARTPEGARESPPPPAPPKDFRVPARRELKLDNGLLVTLVPYGPTPTVDVQLVLLTSGVHEASDQVWMAKLTATMLPEGTTTRPAKQLAREAARMGGNLDAEVTPDETVLGGSALSEFTPDFVALLADMARNPAFPQSGFNRLKADLLREVSIARSQPQQLSREKFFARLYPGHSYGRLFPTEPMLKDYRLEQVRAFYDANYGAARAHLYVAGQFDSAATEAAIRKAFGDWKAGPGRKPNVPSPATGSTVILVDRPGAVQSSVNLGLPVLDPSSPDYIRMVVANALLGGSFASRITSNIREQKGYTYSPRGTLGTQYRAGYWVETADVTTDVTGPAIHEILHELERLRTEPPSEKELEAVKRFAVGSFILQNSSSGSIISRLRFVDLHQLPPSFLDEYVKRVMEVTPQDVQRMAQQYLLPDKLVIVVVGDRKVVERQLQPFGKVALEPPASAAPPPTVAPPK